ncbi:NAD-dependent succinate-semialdehyde dehydrogenase [Nocardia sp. NPDC002869]|uniref:NAD-dependent succinate-semialdehyde dehydrogenase n=1 Tax=Nocardia sp. NPDC002869 TaxID=3161032 RepID=UPI00398D4B36
MSTYAVVDPATGEKVEEFATLTDAALDTVLDRADQALRDWGRRSTVAQRAELLGRVAALYTERREELARVIGREMGKPLTQALGEVDFSAAIYQYYADSAQELLADEPIDLVWGTGTAVVRRAPLGALLGIMPWNYPYYQVARFAAPNLLVGNPIVLKHAAQCPASAAAIEQIFDDAGYPVGAYTNVYATYQQIDRIIADPRVHGVSVTGSERVGALVAEAAGRNLKKVVLELGGSDPFIVLSTDDLAATVDAALAARFYENAGQLCCGAKRFIVIDELYDEFLELLVSRLAVVTPGDPAAPETVLGPVSSLAAARHLEDQLRRAVAGGAKVVLGGKRDGARFEPTVLVDIDPANEAAREEFFGPFAHLYRVSSEAEAVEVANDTPYGLGSYIYSTDTEQACRVADQLEVGMVFVNLVGADEPGLPFGGVKNSGFGRELGRFGIEEFVNRKLIRIGAGHR